MDARRIFIGDIHGDSEELDRLLKELKVTKEDEVIFLGDYVDRGDNSKKVLDRLVLFKEEFPKTVFLWGNHDLDLYQWLVGSNFTYADSRNGIKTLRNLVDEPTIYEQMGGVYKGEGRQMKFVAHEIKEKVLAMYEDFFKGLVYSVEYAEQIAVHGGLNFATKDPVRGTPDKHKVIIRGFIEGSPLQKDLIIGHTSFNDITTTKDNCSRYRLWGRG